MSTETLLVMLAKAAEPGCVKTRMIAALGAEGAANLHRRLCSYVLTQLAPSDLPLQLHYASTSGRPDAFLSGLADQYGIALLPQQGADLGQRMATISECALSQYRRVILIGADCPFIHTTHLQQLLDSLDQGCQAALIPALDGGYVAIALSAYDASIFAGIEWGTERVCAQTVARFNSLGWRYRLLPELADIDRPEDLPLLHRLPDWEGF